MFNLLSEINSDTLAISLVIIILFTLITAVLAFVAVFLIGKYHSVDDEDTLKVGKLKIGYMIAILLVIGLAVRLLLTFTVNGYGASYNTVYTIANNVINVNDGFGGYTSSFIGVAPLMGYLYTLFGGWGVALGVGQDDIAMQLFVKLPYLLSDIAMFFVLYWILKKYVNRYVALTLSGLYFLSPLSFVMSAMWGSEYALLALGLVLTFYFLLTKNVFGMTVAMSLSCLVSSDAVYMAPVVAVYLVYAFVKAIIKIVKTKPSFDMLFKDSSLYNVLYVPLCMALGVALIYLLALPAYFADGVVSFAAVMEQLFVKPFLYASGEGALYYFTENGLSIYTIFMQNYATLGTNFPTLAFAGIFVFLVAVIVTVIFLLRRNRANILLLSSYVSLTVGVYCIGASEWTLVPSLALMLLAFAVVKDKRLLKVYAVMSVFIVLNALLVMFGGGQITPVYTEGYFNMTENGALNVFSVLLSVLTVLMHIYCTVVVLDVALTKNRKPFLTDTASSCGEIVRHWVRG